MQGRSALLVKVLAATAVVCFITGCEPPRVKSIESTQAATNSNPQRDFDKQPLDPYSWGGIASATGGREPRTTYGALAPSGNDGVDEVYMPIGPNVPASSKDSMSVYMVPDPRRQNKVDQFVGSRYLDNEGNDLVKRASVVKKNPPRAALVFKKPAPKPEAAASEHSE